MPQDRTTSDFSESFSRHLRDYMADHGITLEAVAIEMKRAVSYVSERTTGVRPPELDLIDAVALLAHVEPWELVARIVAAGHSARRRSLV